MNARQDLRFDFIILHSLEMLNGAYPVFLVKKVLRWCFGEEGPYQAFSNSGPLTADRGEKRAIRMIKRKRLLRNGPYQTGGYTGNMNSHATQPMKTVSMISVMVHLLSEHLGSSWAHLTELSFGKNDAKWQSFQYT
jgi:hypothetical protein